MMELQYLMHYFAAFYCTVAMACLAHHCWVGERSSPTPPDAKKGDKKE
jgi:hypothetical protein